MEAGTQKGAIPNDRLLAQLLESIQPVNFQLKAYPESLEILNQIEVLKPHVFNADGSYNDSDSNEIREYTRLQKRITGLKVTKAKYMIIVLDEIARIAKENNFGLCKRNGSVYVFNSCFWAEIEKDRLAHFLGNAALKMGMNQYECRVHTFREDIYKQFLSEAYLEVPESDNDSTLINLLNGTYEVSSKGKSRLREFRQSDFLTHQLNFNFDADADAPVFKNYLKEVLPDIKKQSVLAEFSAYVFVKASILNLSKILILYGGGANGKSLYFNILNALLGSANVSNYSLNSLTDSTGYSRAKLGGKLLNYSSELSSKLDVNIFKQLTSNEPIECRLPYGEPFILSEYAKLVANTNQLPRSSELTLGYFRRWLIIHFDQTIKEENQDTDLASKIIDNELSGVLNWVLLGLDRLLAQRGFTKCKAIDEALSQYQTDSDSVLTFISEMGYRHSASEYTPMKLLYDQYRFFCLDNGYRSVNLKNFKARLESQGFEAKRRSIGNTFNLVKDLSDADSNF